MDRKAFEIHDLDNRELPVLYHVGGNGTISNWHENLEILYCTAGKGLLVCGGVEHTMLPGHLYACNSNEMHAAFDQGALKYDCLIVDMQFLKLNAIRMDQVELKTDIFSPEAVGIMKQIAGEMAEQDPYCAPRVRALCLLLMVLLLRNFSKDTEESSRFQSSDEPIKQAVAYIHGNYAERMTLESLASSTGFSKCYFARRFKKITGMTVVNYINLIRCRKAQKLLEKGQLSVLQVANRCGFENASYFSRTFRTVIGHLPSESCKTDKE